ncbi:MAG: CHASE domain-containing protein [Oligoflexia bacterium]|nr:CHASE domain-containing protein [Oligoflexia bacterium]
MKPALKSIGFFLLWLLPGLAVCLFISLQIRKTISDFEERKENQIFSRSTLTIKDSFERYVYGLQGVKGTYSALNNEVRTEHFKNYSKSREYFNNFPGALGFGFIRYISEREFSDYLKKIYIVNPTFSINRLDSVNNFGNYFVIEQIEPIEQNQKALGLDIGSEVRRREAAEKSILSGAPTLTATIKLVQDNKKENGFLFLLPIYKTIFTPESKEERRKNIFGWAYTPLLIEKLFHQLEDKLDPRVLISISDLTSDIEESIYKSDKIIDKKNIGNTFKSEIIIGGRRWVFKGESDVSYRNPAYAILPYIIFILTMIANTIGVFLIHRFFRLKKQAEEKSKYASSWQQAVLDGANYSIISTKPNGIISTFNRAAEKMLGYKSEEVINKTSPSIFHEKSEIEFRAMELTQELGEVIEPGFNVFIAKALKSKNADINEWTYIRKDGSKFPVQLSVTVMRDNAGDVIGYLGIGEDKTAQKSMEKQINDQQAKMIQSAKMAALGEMAGSIAHEINNPLAIIMAKSGQLKDDPIISSKEQIRSEIAKIESTSERIAKIVKGLRIFSRNSENDPAENILLEHPIEDALSLCTEKFKKEGIRLKISVIPNTPIKGRRVQLAQVFMNLLSNAFDAIRNLDEKWIEVRTEIEDGLVKVYFIDSGKGIPSEIEPKIMNPFFTTKEVGLGTGLGLSISKGIIEDHSGVLNYELIRSNTAFVVTLPISKS